MKFKRYNTDEYIDLKNCPFCGGEPNVSHIGNNYTKKRKLQIKCKSCRVTRVNGAITHSFDFLEDVSSEQWNLRVLELSDKGVSDE